MKPVPLLARIRVATPCRADWNEMTGDARVRHCAHCDKHVFNLSEMTREQAEALIIAKNGDLCARYYQRQDGTILLADCSIGLAQKRKTRMVAAGAMALLAGSGGLASYLKLRHHQAAERLPSPVVAVTVEPILPPPPRPPEDATAIMGDVGAPDVDVEQLHELEAKRAALEAKVKAQKAAVEEARKRHRR